MLHRLMPAGAAIVALVSLAGAEAFAHGGGKDRFGGHTEKATGLYHCHTKKAPAEQRELCEIVAKGKNADALAGKLEAAERTIKHLQDAANVTANELDVKLSIAKKERDEALAANTALQRKAKRDVDRAWSAALEERARYRGLMTSTQKDRDAAERMRTEAKKVLQQAEARERGAGPSAGRDCRAVLQRLVIDADTGWLSDSVKVDKEGRRTIDATCLR